MEAGLVPGQGGKVLKREALLISSINTFIGVLNELFHLVYVDDECSV